VAGGQIHNLIRYLRRAAADGPAVPDAQLLARFADARDETAFEQLAWRHGPMVLGVCRRILGDTPDAEDAFQATFLVLARKAASAAQYRSAGGWLHTVAYHVAVRARSRRAARTARERPLDEPALAVVQDPAGEAAWRETRRLIDEEVNRLPEKYRTPFVLYHLEGRSCAEVAHELGRPIGTVESQLTRARARLRSRLTRRGLTTAGGMLAVLAQRGRASPAAAAARAVLKADRGTAGVMSTEAAALADEVVRALGMAKVKVVVAAVLVAVVAAGLAVGMRPRVEPSARPGVPEAARRDDSRPAEQARAVKLVTLHGHSGLNAIALSPDGKVLASAGTDYLVKLWDVEARKERATLREAADPRMPIEPRASHVWSVQAVVFSPDGKTLASASNDQTVKLWDVATGAEKATLRGHTVFLYSVAFSPDSKTLASAGGVQLAAFKSYQSLKDVPKDDEALKETGEVKVWDLATGKERTFYRGDTGRVFSVAFSPDGKTLAAGLRDGAIRLWDVATGGERACFREKAEVHAVAFSPNGKTLASTQGDKVKLWDLASGTVRAQLQGHAGRVQAVAFSPDGTLATAGNVPSRDPQKSYDATGEVRLWNAATGQPRGAPLTFLHYGSSVAFGAHGKNLAAGGTRGSQGQFGGGPGEITLWDLAPRGGTSP
jgi:RNA polymerase sigma factor (sigma-70 family)